MKRDVVAGWASLATLDQTMAIFRDGLSMLTANQRAIVTMRNREGMTFSHIAAELDISTRAVTRCYARAVQSLERHIQQRIR